MNSYANILNQNGLKEFKAMIKKWNALSKNMKEQSIRRPLFLPDIFLVSPPGGGRTHLLKLLADYLTDQKNLMDFYGDVKYFEFMLNYCKPSESFTEIQRLMGEVVNAAGFRNEYKGIVYIDIDEWLGHQEEKHFISFLEYLSDNSDDWLIVLSVSDKKSEQIGQMEAIISAFLRIKRITLEAPTKEDLLRYLQDLLLTYGFILNSEAEKILGQSIVKLSEDKYFDGYKTVKRLCQDIVFHLYSENKTQLDAVSADDVSLFSVDSTYVKRVEKNIEIRRKIGFY